MSSIVIERRWTQYKLYPRRTERCWEKWCLFVLYVYHLQGVFNIIINFEGVFNIIINFEGVFNIIINFVQQKMSFSSGIESLNIDERKLSVTITFLKSRTVNQILKLKNSHSALAAIYLFYNESSILWSLNPSHYYSKFLHVMYFRLRRILFLYISVPYSDALSQSHCIWLRVLLATLGPLSSELWWNLQNLPSRSPVINLSDAAFCQKCLLFLCRREREREHLSNKFLQQQKHLHAYRFFGHWGWFVQSVLFRKYIS